MRHGGRPEKSLTSNLDEVLSNSNMDIQEELDRILEALENAAVLYALCGGLAVVVHGYPRLTKDVDLLIEESMLPTAREALASIGYSIEGGRLKFDIGTKKEHEIFRLSRAEGTEFLSVDLLLVGSFYADAWASRETWLIADREIAVVSREALINMKRASGRTQDLLDIEHLSSGDEDGP